MIGNCSICKSVMKPLFTGFYCPNDCDKKNHSDNKQQYYVYHAVNLDLKLQVWPIIGGTTVSYSDVIAWDFAYWVPTLGSIEDMITAAKDSHMSKRLMITPAKIINHKTVAVSIYKLGADVTLLLMRKLS